MSNLSIYLSTWWVISIAYFQFYSSAEIHILLHWPHFSQLLPFCYSYYCIRFRRGANHNATATTSRKRCRLHDDSGCRTSSFSSIHETFHHHTWFCLAICSCEDTCLLPRSRTGILSGSTHNLVSYSPSCQQRLGGSTCVYATSTVTIPWPFLTIKFIIS